MPALGGAIEYLRYCGEAVLRAPAASIATPREGACFSMIPYANRVNRGRFVHEGETWQLPLEPHRPHAMHGVGWKVCWRCVEHSSAHVVLAYRHAGDSLWPWPFAAEQRLSLERDGCTISLSVKNLDSRLRPAGIGLHCFFPLRRSTALYASAAQMWRCDAACLPINAVAAQSDGEWLAGKPLATLPPINNPFEDWDGYARIAQGAHTITLSATGTRYFHLYRPESAEFFAFEPVDHIPDALNRGAMPQLSPDAVAKIVLQIQYSSRVEAVRIV